MKSRGDIFERLDPGERTLWSGRPIQGLALRLTDWFLIPMSAAWTAFCVYLAVSALTAPRPDGPAMDQFVFECISVLFCAIGAYLLVGRFFVDFWRRRNTFYAVTSKRILIETRWPVYRRHSYDLAALSDIRLEEGFGTRGTIRISGGDLAMFYLMGGNESWPWAALAAPPTFDRIEDARHVFKIIQEARQGKCDDGRDDESLNQPARARGGH